MASGLRTTLSVMLAAASRDATTALHVYGYVAGTAGPLAAVDPRPAARAARTYLADAAATLAGSEPPRPEPSLLARGSLA